MWCVGGANTRESTDCALPLQVQGKLHILVGFPLVVGCIPVLGLLGPDRACLHHLPHLLFPQLGGLVPCRLHKVLARPPLVGWSSLPYGHRCQGWW